MPTHRYLRGYALDPSFSTLLSTYAINETVYRIRWEKELEPGPKGEYLAIIDFDPPSNKWYRPININDIDILSQNGLRPSEGNPQFHQQFVYTIAMRIIETFEDALGRKIIWRPKLSRDDKGRYDEQFIKQLKIYPHALLEANAYYTRDKKAILFGYFKSKDIQQGVNVPGGTVFTCLSPDIIAHEMSHAILDSIHPHFIENTNPDVGAFHEAFADTVALLERFNNRDLVVHQLTFSDGKLDNETIFGDLATQVGQAISFGHTALRNAIGHQDKDGKWIKHKPDRNALSETAQVHERGAIFVACIFDAFIRLYNYRTNDLFRIAKIDKNSSELLHPDLIQRLATEAIEISQNLLKICIQALDFVPPCDITFGDYIRALITADFEMAPEDHGGYRVALIEAFREWGFQVDRVNTMSVDSLQWESAEQMFKSDYDRNALKIIINNLRPKIRELFAVKDREKIHEKTNQINILLHALITKGLPIHEDSDKVAIKELNNYYKIVGEEGAKLATEFENVRKNNKDWQKFLEKLGLHPSMKHIHKYNDATIPFKEAFKLQVLNIRPVYRTSREGMRIDQVVVSLLQTLRVNKPGHSLNNLKYRGGCTLVFDLSEEAPLNYAIVKRLKSERRLDLQLKYQLGLNNFYANNSSYMDKDLSFEPLSIQNLHSHE